MAVGCHPQFEQTYLNFTLMISYVIQLRWFKDSFVDKHIKLKTHSTPTHMFSQIGII